MPSSDRELIRALTAALTARADPARAVEQQRYTKSDLPYLGVTLPDVRRAVRDVLATRRLTSRGAWDATARALVDEATHRELWHAAVELTGHRHYREWQDPRTIGLYRHLIMATRWWDVVDDVAVHRIGPILLRHIASLDSVMRQWAVDDDMWVRRAAILSQLNHKDATDTALLEGTITPNLKGTAYGSELFIRKAIGWALRQYARTDPDWVLAHVEAYGDRLSGLSRREALKHL